MALKFALVVCATAFVVGTATAVERQSCKLITGRVVCPEGSDHDKHDNSVVIVQLKSKDGYRDRIDEGFVSKNGYFAVSGCQRDIYKAWEPELHIFHTCKQKQKRRLKIPIITPLAEYNVPQTINLRSYSVHEEPFEFDNRPPCVP